MDLREFRPHSNASRVLDETTLPWLKKLSRKHRAILKEQIAQTIGYAVDEYLSVTTANLAIKRKLNAPIERKELEATFAEMRRILRRLKEFAPGRPGRFDRKNVYYRRGDEKAPFFTEGYLYPLFGKDEARSLLYAFEQICTLAGLTDE